MRQVAASGSRILIVGPSWVGDMVMAQSLFMTLKSRWPDCHISVLAPGWTELLLKRMPEVSEAIPAAFQHGKFGLSERWTLARRCRNSGFDQAIVLPRSLKSALIPWLAGIPRRTGYRGEMRYGLINDMRVLNKKVLPLTVQRFVSLGHETSLRTAPEYAFPRLSVSSQSVALALESLQLDAPQRPLLGLCPGAEYGPAKRWPVRHFITLAQRAIEAGFAVWLFGSDKDRTFSREIRSANPHHCVDLAGRTRLDQVIDLMSLCATVVSNDSGLMHVAAALNRQVIALYGSSSPGFTPPLSEHARIVSLNLECSPCFKRTCPLQHLDCLNNLSPDRVLKAFTP